MLLIEKMFDIAFHWPNRFFHPNRVSRQGFFASVGKTASAARLSGSDLFVIFRMIENWLLVDIL